MRRYRCSFSAFRASLGWHLGELLAPVLLVAIFYALCVVFGLALYVLGL